MKIRPTARGFDKRIDARKQILHGNRLPRGLSVESTQRMAKGPARRKGLASFRNVYNVR
jgi:hypothetical protein